MTTSQAFQTAVAHQRAGRFGQAEEIYRQILLDEPHNASAMHMLGVVLLHTGRHDAAVGLILGAIGLDAHQAVFHNSLGEAHFFLRRFAEAKTSLTTAIGLAPRMAQPHYTLALVHVAEGDMASALERCRKALALKPDFAEAHQLQGKLLRKLGDAKLAEHDWPAAVAWYQEALDKDPNSAQIEAHLGTARQAQGQLDVAMAHYQRALELKPDYAFAHYNLATALELRSRTAEAAEHYETALRLNPNFAGAHTALGVADQELCQYEQALAHFDAALQLEPDSIRAQYNRALVRLAQGDWAAAWPEFEARLRYPDFPVRRTGLPAWDGSPLHDQSLLVHSEQGLGDVLHLIRYVPWTQQRAAKVVVCVHTPLVPLLRQSGFDVIGEVDVLPATDFQVAMMSLPGLYGTTVDHVPAEVPYLSARADLVETWRERLRDLTGFRVGICSRGSPLHRDDPWRSIPFGQFESLAHVPGVRLVSLQKGYGIEDLKRLAAPFELHELGPDWDQTAGPFMDSAAVMMNLDLVITCDTVTAHLAGALGVPVWVALARRADWRWLLAREDTPWYPSMRLFRQSRLGDWSDVFEQIAARLRDLVLQPGTRGRSTGA